MTTVLQNMQISWNTLGIHFKSFCFLSWILNLTVTLLNVISRQFIDPVYRSRQENQMYTLKLNHIVYFHGWFTMCRFFAKKWQNSRSLGFYYHFFSCCLALKIKQPVCATVPLSQNQYVNKLFACKMSNSNKSWAKLGSSVLLDSDWKGKGFSTLNWRHWWLYVGRFICVMSKVVEVQNDLFL